MSRGSLRAPHVTPCFPQPLSRLRLITLWIPSAFFLSNAWHLKERIAGVVDWRRKRTMESDGALYSKVYRILWFLGFIQKCRTSHGNTLLVKSFNNAAATARVMPNTTDDASSTFIRRRLKTPRRQQRPKRHDTRERRPALRCPTKIAVTSVC